VNLFFELKKTSKLNAIQIYKSSVFNIILNHTELGRDSNFICYNNQATMVNIMKSIIVSDLISLRAQFKLVIWSSENFINFLLLLLSIEMIICLQEEFLVVILIQDFILPKLLIAIWISLIFLNEKLEKLFFNLKISLTFPNDTWVYKCPFFLLY